MITIKIIVVIAIMILIKIILSDARWLPLGADGVGALEAEMTRVAGTTIIVIMIVKTIIVIIIVKTFIVIIITN